MLEQKLFFGVDMKKFLSLLLFFIYSICNAAESPITIVIPFAVGGSSDSVARIIQHEIDHLNGVLLQDHILKEKK